MRAWSGLEAPGVHANGHIVSQQVVAGEIEVDHTGNAVVKEKDVVREKVGMNDALGQVWPLLAESFEFRANFPAMPGSSLSATPSIAAKSFSQPAMERAFSRLSGKSQARFVQCRECRAKLPAMRGLWLSQ